MFHYCFALYLFISGTWLAANIKLIGKRPQTLKVTQKLSLCVLQTASLTIAKKRKKYGFSIVPVYIERIKNYHFKLYFNKPVKFDDNLSHKQITLELNKILEKMILKNPDQWIWSHDRWK